MNPVLKAPTQSNPSPTDFDPFAGPEPIGITGSLETPNGAFSFDGRAYVFAGIADAKYSRIRRLTDPSVGQYLFSKPDPTVPGPYDLEFLVSPKLGWCAKDSARASFLSHDVHGLHFVPTEDVNDPKRSRGWHSCKKCDALFWDGNPSFKGVCQRGGVHEADSAPSLEFSFAAGNADDEQQQANWKRCDKCLALFWDGDPKEKGLCPAGGVHSASTGSLLVAHVSIEEDAKNQRHWRFCGKCFTLVFAGSGPGGVCPADGAAHAPIGYEFVLPHDIGEDAEHQAHWRFCGKCGELFYDGYLDKGYCRQDGGGHSAAGYDFSLPHSMPETATRQANWNFCSQCSALFFSGYSNKGVCPRNGAGHTPAGLDFVLPHNPADDLGTQAWRFCVRCHGLVRSDQPGYLPWVAPVVSNNAPHSGVLPLQWKQGTGLFIFSYDWPGTISLAWMPLTQGTRPRFDQIQYFHRTSKTWTDYPNRAPGYELFTQLHPGQYTHLSAAWFDKPGCWVVLYATAWDAAKTFTSPVMARIGRSLLDWSNEIPIFDPVREGAYGAYMHDPGRDKINPNVPPEQPPPQDEPGWAYGPFLLNRYCTWDEASRTLSLYYLLSLSSPYQVQVMHCVLQIPA